MKTRLFWLAALTLLAALMISGTAFAEGDTPPAEAPAAEPAEAEPAEAAPEEAPPAVPLAPAAEPAEAPAVEEPAAAAPAVIEEALPAAEEAAVPAEEPVLVDAAGEPLVLASEESAEILAAADPYFKSGDTTYSFYQAAGACLGAPNCFDGLANPIQSAIDYIRDHGTVPNDGSIYVEKATYTGNVVVDGDLANLNSLTGLVGLPSGGLFPTISGTLTLKNLPNGFSLLGFNVTGGVLVENSDGQFKFDMVTGNLTMNTVNSSGSTGTGIHIKDHRGNIVLDSAISNNNTKDGPNPGHGVWVENQLLGNVTITDSYFQDNESDGIKLAARGIVTIDNVVANGNTIGINVNTCSALTIKNTDASNNQTAGIWVDAMGKAVTLDSVTAYKNGDSHPLIGYGIYLSQVGAVNANKVTANENFKDGLRINTIGTITLTSITAVDNDDDGVVVISPVSAAAINGIVTNDNDSVGLVVETKGAIIRNAIALNNGDGGILLKLSGGTGLLENVNANDNTGWGVYVETSPAAVVNISLKNVGASRNDGGIHIETLGSVTLVGSGAFQSKTYDGVYIATRGAVKLTDLWSGYNAGSGLKIEGIYTEAFIGSEWKNVSMVSPASVLINISTNKTSLNGFQSNGQADDWVLGVHGAFIISERSVVINDFNANENHGYGIYVTGPELYDIALGYDVLRRSGAVTIACTLPNQRSSAGQNMFGLEIYSAGTVTITGLDTWENSNHGVDVNTLGAIVLRNARDNRNGESNSIALYNDEAIGFMPVTISNVEVYETQADWGAALLVHSRGAINITGMNMWGNNSMGAALANAMTGKGSITVSNANIKRSAAGDGLQAFSNGAIILNNVYIYENGQAGAYLTNRDAPILAPVTLTNCDFSQNESGLKVESKGLITLRNVSANDNRWIGIDLFNNYNGTAAGINLTNVSADNNNGSGIMAQTNGSAVLNSIYTHNNAKRWGDISSGETVQDFFNQSQGPDNWYFAADYDVTYTFKIQADAAWDLNRAGFDPFVELYDGSDNPIAVSVYCEENDYCEFDFRPDDFGYTGTDKYYVRVGSNTNDGFYRLSFNDSDPSNPTMYWVSGTGVTAGGSITVNGIESHNNSLIGLGPTVTGSGTITLSNLHISDNGSEGIYIQGNTGAITLSGDSHTHWNGWEGLIIYTNGAVTIRKLDASGNGQPTGSSAVKIHGDSAPKALSFSNINIDNTGGVGLWAFSTSNITLTNVNVNNNNNTGIYLDNCLDDGLGDAWARVSSPSTRSG